MAKENNWMTVTVFTRSIFWYIRFLSNVIKASLTAMFPSLKNKVHTIMQRFVSDK